MFRFIFYGGNIQYTCIWICFLTVVKKIIILLCSILRGITAIIFYKALTFLKIVENVSKIFYKSLNVGTV